MDILFSEADIQRHLRVTDSNGNRVPGLEARLARRQHDDLVYIANERGQAVEFKIDTDSSYNKIRELRSLKHYSKATGRIEKGQVLLFSLQKDPTVSIADKYRKK